MKILTCSLSRQSCSHAEGSGNVAGEEVGAGPHWNGPCKAFKSAVLEVQGFFAICFAQILLIFKTLDTVQLITSDI